MCQCFHTKLNKKIFVIVLKSLLIRGLFPCLLPKHKWVCSRYHIIIKLFSLSVKDCNRIHIRIIVVHFKAATAQFDTGHWLSHKHTISIELISNNFRISTRLSPDRHSLCPCCRPNRVCITYKEKRFTARSKWSVESTSTKMGITVKRLILQSIMFLLLLKIWKWGNW